MHSWTMFIFNIEYKFYIWGKSISKIKQKLFSQEGTDVLLWLVHKFSYPIYFFHPAYHAIEKKGWNG